MKSKIYVVDAFTKTPFTGNPACVCFLQEAKEDQWMQNVAFEMRLSETAFLFQQEDGFSLRWFTPKTEVDLCGHATLAAAHILWETGILKPDETAKFETNSGTITADKVDDLVEMKFPILYQRPADFNPELISAFNITPMYVGSFENKLLIEVDGEEIVKSIEPDFRKLQQFDERAVVITSLAESEEYDFVSRHFAPWVGVYEDPVTGSNHSCLGPYWARRLDKTELKAYQASPRGGMLNLRVEKDCVYIGGNAITVYEGELFV